MSEYTWREDELDELIAAYYADVKLLASNTRAYRGRKLDPTVLPARGYDGRLFDWLVDMLILGVPDGPEQAWPIIVKLVANAPDDLTLGFIGAGPIEDLVNHHGHAFCGRLIAETARDARFRFALGHVWFDGHAPKELQELIVRIRSGDEPGPRRP
jgi:hypothetical protein